MCLPVCLSFWFVYYPSQRFILTQTMFFFIQLWLVEVPIWTQWSFPSHSAAACVCVASSERQMAVWILVRRVNSGHICAPIHTNALRSPPSAAPLSLIHFNGGIKAHPVLVTPLASPWLPENDSFRHKPLGQWASVDYNKSDKAQTECRMVILTSAFL